MNKNLYKGFLGSLMQYLFKNRNYARLSAHIFSNSLLALITDYKIMVAEYHFLQTCTHVLHIVFFFNYKVITKLQIFFNYRFKSFKFKLNDDLLKHLKKQTCLYMVYQTTANYFKSLRALHLLTKLYTHFFWNRYFKFQK